MKRLLWGLICSLAGNCLMGASFTLKRWVSGGASGQPLPLCKRLSNWRWWFALLSLFSGEALNFGAYVTVPSFLVVMLGCVNVLSTQLTSAVFLREYFTSVRLIGTLSVALGVTLCIISTPLSETAVVATLPDIVARLAEPDAQILLTAALTCFLVLAMVAARLERQRVRPGRINNEPVKTSITALGLALYGIGAMMTVPTTKAVGIIANEAVFSHRLYWAYPPFYFVLLAAIVLWTVQLILLNWLLAHIEASAITPLMYLVYTLCGAFASGTYYKEFLSYDLFQLVVLGGAALMLAFGTFCVTQVYPREQGFWPWCCPVFKLTTGKTIALLEIPKARDKWIHEHSAPSEPEANTNGNSALLAASKSSSSV